MHCFLIYQVRTLKKANFSYFLNNIMSLPRVEHFQGRYDYRYRQEHFESTPPYYTIFLKDTSSYHQEIFTPRVDVVDTFL